MSRAVERWTALLATAATFVDGDRWAQFDVGNARIALAGTDRVSDETGLMIKVDDLNEARTDLDRSGVALDGTERGAHEVRATVAGADLPIVFYESRR